MGKSEELTLNISGMHCASCVAGIERGVGEITGVEDCRVNLATRSGVVRFDPSRVTAEQIIAVISKSGFESTRGAPDIVEATQRELRLAFVQFQVALALAIPLMAFSMWPMMSEGGLVSPLWDSVVQLTLATLLLFVAGRSILADAARQTVHGRANMNSLIALGTLTAFIWSLVVMIRSWPGPVDGHLYFESAGMIITLILLGRYLEARARGRAGQALGALVKMQPDQARAIINDVEVEIEAGALQKGMMVQVRPGERLPADGTIVEGQPSLDESLMTGESLPVDKNPGDSVIGGSLNTNTPFRYQVTAPPGDGFLANMVRLVSEAQSRKAPVQKLADRVAAVFVPIVLGLALLTAGLWYWLDPTNPLLIQCVVSVLIIACPCALGLATPTAILAGTGRAAREGVIIRGGDVLQRLTEIDCVVFDKTGTLTQGELEVVETREFANVSHREMLRMVGSLEQTSEHPVARAIVRYVEAEQLEPKTLTKVEARPGLGIVGEHNGRVLLAGNQALMNEYRVDMSPVTEAARQQMAKGRTTVFVALDGQVIGLVALSDRIRAEAQEAMARLRPLVEKITIISGDSRAATAEVARSLGIEEFEAEVLPEQKQIVIHTYGRAGCKPLMVGDGINDAPALAAAEVGIAIASGTDVAIEAADVILVESDLMAVPRTLEIANASLRIIKQNLFWAFFYNILAIPLAAGLLYPFLGWSLSPMVAAAAMAFSSVFVVTNSLRLNRLDLT
jgi:Cu+-exporting ATPase